MQLNIKQRFAAVAIYILIILGIGYYFTNDFRFVTDTSNKLNTVLITTALSLLFGAYITEPYFSKPVDVITRWIAVFLFLIGLKKNDHLILYKFWIYCSILFTSIALILILLHGFKKFEKFQRIAVDFICKISRPEIVFTLLYLDIVVSFFQPTSVEYPILIGFGFLLAINKPITWIIKWISSYIFYITETKRTSIYIGKVIGHESKDLYNVEIESNSPFRQKNLRGELIYLENISNGVAGIVLSERILLGKKWLQILSLYDKNGNLITFNLKSLEPLANQKSIFSKTNAVYTLTVEDLEGELFKVINNNYVYLNFKNIIGYVWEGSTINKIKFYKLFTEELLEKLGVGEGSIIETSIGKEEVIYQIIDAKTDEESLEYKDSYGFTIGTAQKLGKYNFDQQELNTVKWLPEIYSIIFLLNAKSVRYDCNKCIGKLPNSTYGIPIKVPAELVTHNTAILGILGIGKSCLTFELLQKLLSTTNVKVFCIDLTNQYARQLPKYVSTNLIQEDFSDQIFAELKSHNLNNGASGNPNSWGNEAYYKTTLSTEIGSFLQSDRRILILNPDLHSVSKAASGFNITHKVDLTASEKTRYISESIFLKAREMGETAEARFLIVFEEAHSLVPEWNSVSSDGDKNATNGTAKVILQGRKYGLGTFVITQRTANISKSILNQCNTIFAMRIFDDTGKQFLENYIGSDYSNLLPTLEERHCIAIGKALKLKQPVILELNSLEDVILQPTRDVS